MSRSKTSRYEVEETYSDTQETYSDTQETLCGDVYVSWVRVVVNTTDADAMFTQAVP